MLKPKSNKCQIANGNANSTFGFWFCVDPSRKTKSEGRCQKQNGIPSPKTDANKEQTESKMRVYNLQK